MRRLAPFVLFVLAACASKEVPESESSKATRQMEAKFKSQVGHATKAAFREEFGPEEWCKVEPNGEETCRFLHKKGTKLIGDKLEKKRLDLSDECIATFDSGGVLKEFKVQSQR